MAIQFKEVRASKVLPLEDWEHPERLGVALHLDPQPPKDPQWQSYFDNPTAISGPAASEPPEIVHDLESGAMVITRAPDEAQLERNVENVLARIAHANARFQSERIPALQRQQKALEESRRKEAERSASLQEMADRLTETIKRSYEAQ